MRKREVDNMREVKTRPYAVAIVELFEDLLDEHGIDIPDEHRNGDDSEAHIYGETYYNLENIDEVFKSKKTTDIISKQTNYGIHRDELIFNLNDKNALRFASQGQIRNIILTVKLTLCEVIYEYKNKYPILLLDDVLSELDINRQNNLLNLLDGFGQTFISTVDTSSLNKEILKKYQIITL